MTVEQPWPLPAVVVAYHITYDGHPDSYPLHIASKVLSDGQSSRIYQSLVYERQLAVTAFGGANLIEDPNLFYAVAIVQPGQSPNEAIDALIAELDELKTDRHHRTRAAAGEEPVRARLHHGARVGAAEGAAARPCGRDSPRHHDGGRRVRNLPADHGRGRAAGRADLFHRREPHRHHHHAVGRNAGGGR
ncbi:MAG: insulinase family protein [Vicinamibacterales bacterium]